MKTWQDNIHHSANCAAATSDDPAPCTCQRDETVAAIEGVLRAAEGVNYGDKVEYVAHLEEVGTLKFALDRLNALNNPNEPKGT